MRVSSALAAIGFASLFASTAAQAEPYSIFYGGASFGAEEQSLSSHAEETVFLGFLSLGTPQEDLTFSLTPDDVGYVVGGAFGWAFEDGLSFEIDLNTQAVNYDMNVTLDALNFSPGLLVLTQSTSTSLVSDRIRATAALANFRYEFLNETRLIPYVLAGIGWSTFETENNTHFLGSTPIRIDIDADGGLAYQLGAGFRTQINSRTDIVIGYRFFSIPEAEISWPSGCSVPVTSPPCSQNHASQDFNFSTHSAIVGLRVGF